MKLIKKDYLMIILIFILFIIFYYLYNSMTNRLDVITESYGSDVEVYDSDIKPKNVLPLEKKFGKYCGSYNLKSNSETECKSDTYCAWNKYVPKNGDPSGWCGLNPEPPY